MKRRRYFAANLENSYDPVNQERRECEEDEANLISSLCDDDYHRPVLDLDIPHELVPSTTPGHSHLYIDVPMTWDQYSRLLEALRDAGVIQRGFANFSLMRGASFARKPGTSKMHRPHRGSDVETWIKRFRDKPWNIAIEHAIDDLLEDYRLRADTGALLLDAE